MYAEIGQASSATATVAYSPVAGNNLFVVVGYQDSGGSHAMVASGSHGLKDQSGNDIPFVECGTGYWDSGSGGYGFHHLRVYNVPAGVTSITHTLVSPPGTLGIGVAEISGLSNSPTVDARANNDNQTAASTGADVVTSGSMTPTSAAAGAGVFAFCGSFSAFETATAGTGFTAVPAGGAGWVIGCQGGFEHKRITSNSSVAATFTAKASGHRYSTYAFIVDEASAPVAQLGAVNRNVGPAMPFQASPRGLTASPNVTKTLTGLTAIFTPGQLSASNAGGYINRNVGPALPFQASPRGLTRSPNVTLSLLGQTATFSLGSMQPTGRDIVPLPVRQGWGPAFGFVAAPRSSAVVPTGNVTITLGSLTATFTPGAIADGVSYAVAGQVATFSEGAIADSTSYGLTGQTATFAQGAIADAVSYVLPSQTSNFTEGALSDAVSYSLAGLTATFAEGSITASSGGNVTTSLTGLTATFSAGAIAAAVSRALTGLTANFSEGALADAVSYGLAGQTATFAEGVITSSAGGNVTVALTGLTATFAPGPIASTASYGISGRTATFAAGAIGAAVSLGLAPQTATFTEGVMSAAWSANINLTGLIATFTPGVIFIRPPVAISGQTSTVYGDPSTTVYGSGSDKVNG